MQPLAVIKSRSRSRFLNSPWTSRLIPYSIIFINFSEHVLKALNSLQTTEEKLAALCKKYADLHEEHRILQTKFKQSQKKLAGVWQTFFCLYEITSKQECIPVGCVPPAAVDRIGEGGGLHCLGSGRCLAWRGVCPGGFLPRVGGGVCPGGWQNPTVDRILDTQVVKTLPCHNYCCGR